VRDLDAHSWVEVYFEGIGWVPFDPTPTAAPAESQSSGFGATSAARADAGEVRSRSGTAASERAAGGAAGAGGADEGGRPWWPLVLLVAAGAAAGVARLVRTRRRRLEGDIAEAQLAELRRALVRLGFSLPATTTLLGLERRLGRTVGPAAAGYAAALRAHRFDPREPEGPGLGERRALRRELSARGGLSARVRGLLAIPPGGPRPL